MQELSGSLARAAHLLELSFVYSLARVAHLLELIIRSLARAAHLLELYTVLTCKSFQSSLQFVRRPKQCRWRVLCGPCYPPAPMTSCCNGEGGPIPYFTTNLASTYIALTANLQVASLTFPLGKVCWKSSLIFELLAKMWTLVACYY